MEETFKRKPFKLGNSIVISIPFYLKNKGVKKGEIYTFKMIIEDKKEVDNNEENNNDFNLQRI